MTCKGRFTYLTQYTVYESMPTPSSRISVLLLHDPFHIFYRRTVKCNHSVLELVCKDHSDDKLLLLL